MRIFLLILTTILLTTSTLFAQFIELKDKHGHRLYQRVEDAKIKFVSAPTFEKCGDFIWHVDQYYATVAIGDQCWFKENLNIGKRIDGTLDQTEADTDIEKYCYNDLESNCDIYGGLYQWREAMQYATAEGEQGICPSGWHIPTYSEMQSLETFVNDQATKLINVNAKNGYSFSNETGFSALFEGRYDENFGFGGLTFSTELWSSSGNIQSNNFMLLLYNYSNIRFASYSSIEGIGVRCLKN